MVPRHSVTAVILCVKKMPPSPSMMDRTAQHSRDTERAGAWRGWYSEGHPRCPGQHGRAGWDHPLPAEACGPRDRLPRGLHVRPRLLARLALPVPAPACLPDPAESSELGLERRGAHAIRAQTPRAWPSAGPGFVVGATQGCREKGRGRTTRSWGPSLVHPRRRNAERPSLSTTPRRSRAVPVRVRVRRPKRAQAEAELSRAALIGTRRRWRSDRTGRFRPGRVGVLDDWPRRRRNKGADDGTIQTRLVVPPSLSSPFLCWGRVP